MSTLSLNATLRLKFAEITGFHPKSARLGVGSMKQYVNFTLYKTPVVAKFFRDYEEQKGDFDKVLCRLPVKYLGSIYTSKGKKTVSIDVEIHVLKQTWDRLNEEMELWGLDDIKRPDETDVNLDAVQEIYDKQALNYVKYGGVVEVEKDVKAGFDPDLSDGDDTQPTGNPGEFDGQYYKEMMDRVRKSRDLDIGYAQLMSLFHTQLYKSVELGKLDIDRETCDKVWDWIKTSNIPTMFLELGERRCKEDVDGELNEPGKLIGWSCPICFNVWSVEVIKPCPSCYPEKEVKV